MATANVCRWINRPATPTGISCLEINGTVYDVLPVLSVGGNVHGYNLHKWDDAGTVYHVDTDFPRWECNCPDSRFRPKPEGCKHIRALKAALQRLQPA